jgi:dephospho-CoA kinase
VEGWQGVLFVDASEALRRQRVQARNPTTADFLWALSNRLPWDEYRKSATFRLVNDTGLTELKAQVEKWLQDQGIKIPRVEPEAPSR